jgi:hypothetical protein
VGAGIMLKSAPAPAMAVASPAAGYAGGGVTVPRGDSLLAAMKEELFALESDRLQGRLTETEYVEQKAALEVVLRRALQRGESAAGTSNVGRAG